jgi:multiphosphoryl transfer protein
MTPRTLQAAPAAPGRAVGPARVLFADAGGDDTVPPERRDEEAAAAASALAAAAEELGALAVRLRDEGRQDEAEIVETGVLMAQDPALLATAEERARADGLTAAAAVTAAAEVHAATLASLDDEMLAARADDVRSLGRRAARLARGDAGSVEAKDGVVLVADDLGPADVAELADAAVAVALAHGGATAHAAIVARSLGLPMVVGAGDALEGVQPGTTVVVDADAGTVVLEPDPQAEAAARDAMAARAAARAREAAERDLPAVTRDGHRMTVLANAASPPEVRAGLDAGAEGVGLLRTELGFLDASTWPSREAHRRFLQPILAELAGRTANVRTLDFGGDKTPPFLAGRRQRGLALQLDAPAALRDQFRAILEAGRETRLRIMLPLVEGPVPLQAARALLAEALEATPGATEPLLGAMVETPRAAAAAHQLAQRADFLSIGTNDLSAATLGSDRFSESDAVAHHPRVLALIERTVRGAAAAGVFVEVCGEAASDPITAPLLIGLGVAELSVAPARVGTVRRWVRALRNDEVQALARRALAAGSADEVAELVRPLWRLLDETLDEGREPLDGGGRVGALRP